MSRFAVTPPPKSSRSPRLETFAAQLALAELHPRLAPVKPVPGGYMLNAELTRNWFELPAHRGLAGYGLKRALRMLLDVLSGLAALHDTKTEAGTGFVHGEVVPALIRVDREGASRLIPLAPWHRLESGVPAAPERQAHLAPERLLGDAIDQRADVFSCGVLLWEALAARRLFEGESIDGIVTRLMGGKLHMPELPPELGWAAPLKSVAMCALAVDPSQRFSDCAELAAAIEDRVLGHVASHAEVAEFFRAGERASMLPPATPLAASHKSSLSALVSPALPREERVLREELAAQPAPASKARGLLASAVLLALLAALGWGAIQHRSSVQHSADGAPRGADLRRANPPDHVPSIAPEPPPAIVAEAPAPAPAAALSALRKPASGVPSAAPRSGKMHSGASATKPAPPSARPHVLKAAPPVVDPGAEHYGI